MDASRRRALIAAGCFPFSIGALQNALAAGRVPTMQGINTIKGEVRVNDAAARVGQNLANGDVVSTGDASEALYVIGDSAFFLRANGRVRIESNVSGKVVMRLLAGAMASVFGKGQHSLQTATATVGVRGTAAYLDTSGPSTYFCLCYGEADLSLAARPGQPLGLTTRHHESPFYIAANGTLTSAPTIGHTDTELIFLEALFGREPPFVGDPGITLYR